MSAIEIVKKTRASKAEMEARNERLVEEFMKENYRISKEWRDNWNAEDGNINSTEDCKQILQQGTKLPTDFNLFMKLITGTIMVEMPTGMFNGRSPRDPRKDRDVEFQLWSSKKIKEWGVKKNPITYNNKEKMLREWFNKWETFEELFAFLEGDELCLK
jgi:hypothetical protein